LCSTCGNMQVLIKGLQAKNANYNVNVIVIMIIGIIHKSKQTFALLEGVGHCELTYQTTNRWQTPPPPNEQ
jgi:hypothetical protein